jgi:hypothetical protein
MQGGFMNEKDFIPSQDYGLKWGMIHAPELATSPRLEPEVVIAAKRKRFEGVFRSDHDREICLDIIA